MDKIIRSPISLDVPGVLGFLAAVAVANMILKKIPALPIIGKVG